MAPSLKYALVPVFIGMAFYGFNAAVIGITKNGFSDVINHLKDNPHAVMRGAPEPLRRHYTGIAAVDNQLVNLVTFFAAIIDTADMDVGWAATTFYIWGMAQFAAGWTLLVLESLRAGNRGRAVSYIATLGLLFQNLSWTFTVPLWLALHLVTSPTASLRRGDGDAARRALFVYLWDMALLPMAVTITYVAPTIFMSMPQLFHQSAATHYSWIAFWQPFPLWTVLCLQALHGFCYYALGSLAPRDEEGNPTTPGKAYMVGVGGVYEFALTLCVVTHLPILLLTLQPSGGGARAFLARIFPEVKGLWSQATFSDVFIPYTPMGAPKVDPATYVPGDLGVLAQHFIHYDFYIGCTAMAMWSAYLYMTAAKDASVDKLIKKSAFWFLVGGPTAVSLALNWARDEATTVGEEDEKKTS